MKKAFFLFTSLLIISVACFATVPADHPKLGDYFNARFKTYAWEGASFDIDFKDVSAIVHDERGQMAMQNVPNAADGWGKHCHWVILKNGKIVILSPTASVRADWSNFKNILKQNTIFMTIP